MTYSITNSEIIFVLNNSNKLDCIVSRFLYMRKDLKLKQQRKTEKLITISQKLHKSRQQKSRSCLVFKIIERRYFWFWSTYSNMAFIYTQWLWHIWAWVFPFVCIFWGWFPVDSKSLLSICIWMLSKEFRESNNIKYVLVKHTAKKKKKRYMFCL